MSTVRINANPSINEVAHALSTQSNSDASHESPEIDPLLALHPLYEVTERLSHGGCGTVYQAKDRNHAKFAIKVQIYDPKRAMLEHESTIYQKLLHDKTTGFPALGIPLVYNYLLKRNCEFLVMQRLGDSLKQKTEVLRSKMFSKKTTLMIGLQVVKRLEMLHKNDILHRDIKPANLVMGLGADEQTVHIIDFGMSTIVDDWKVYNPDLEEPFVGTFDFAPVEAFFQKQPTRAGDLQSLAYTLIDMATGSLPWVYRDQEYDRALTLTELGIQRLTKKPVDLCVDFPELTRFVKLVCRMKKGVEPDYDVLLRELEEALEAIGCENDGIFDWLEESTKEIDAAGNAEQGENSDDLYYDVPPMLRSVVEPRKEDDIGDECHEAAKLEQMSELVLPPSTFKGEYETLRHDRPTAEIDGSIGKCIQGNSDPSAEGETRNEGPVKDETGQASEQMQMQMQRPSEEAGLFQSRLVAATVRLMKAVVGATWEGLMKCPGILL